MPGYTSVNPCPYDDDLVASFHLLLILPSLLIHRTRFHLKTKIRRGAFVQQSVSVKENPPCLLPLRFVRTPCAETNPITI